MDRIDRISSEMQKVISEIIREDIKDPRIPLMTSVVSANVTRDLKYAKIYVSVLGTEKCNSRFEKFCWIYQASGSK